jgi:pimeloyl-ACP methyl ester carboxylesterase
MKGEILLYEANKRLTVFTGGDSASNLCVLLIGGLGDGFLTVPVSEGLAAFCSRRNIKFAQALLSSSYKSFGFSSVKQDAQELECCMDYLLCLNPELCFVLVGFSTGGQDVIHFLNYNLKEHQRVIGAVLMSMVSDRDYAENSEDPQFKHLEMATKMIKEGNGNEMMPRSADFFEGHPITAYRYHSLISPHGDDDFVSLDLPADYQKQFFSFKTPVTIVYAGADQYIPKNIAINDLVKKMKQFTPVKQIKVIKDADHELSASSSQQEFLNFLEQSIHLFQELHFQK